MPKVYETSTGRKATNFTLYPSWRCPRCHLMRREAIGRACRSCKSKEQEDNMNTFLASAKEEKSATHK